MFNILSIITNTVSDSHYLAGDSRRGAGSSNCNRNKYHGRAWVRKWRGRFKRSSRRFKDQSVYRTRMSLIVRFHMVSKIQDNFKVSSII